MCATCGCSDDAGVLVTDPDHEHDRAHDHDHDHGHAHSHEHDHGTRTVSLEADIVGQERSARRPEPRLVRGPGHPRGEPDELAGFGQDDAARAHHQRPAGTRELSVVEGDQETLLDADRIRAAGAPVVQINTGTRLPPRRRHVGPRPRALDPARGSVVLIENVGNLVCPALFDLGETARVVIMSVTEGADKPLKYPHMFRTADLLILNKIDLLPYVEFDVDACVADARKLRPELPVITLSATKGDGLEDWYAWLRARWSPPIPDLAGLRLRRRRAAMAAWPMLIPASLGGDAFVDEHLEPRAERPVSTRSLSSAFWNTPPVRATVPMAWSAASRAARSIAPAAPPRGCRPRSRPGPGLTPARRPPRQISGAGSITSSPASSAWVTRPDHPGRASRRASASSSTAACAS